MCKEDSYLIHACKSRKWYVDKYLIPSIRAQGVSYIHVYLDENEEGNLISTMKSFSKLDKEGATWHLQDDVIVSRKFAYYTKLDYKDKIVNGFCSNYCKSYPVGEVSRENMWYSFPCIRIPNKIALEFSEWMKDVREKQVLYYKSWFKANKFDDSFFREFLMNNYPDIKAINLVPNIVNHIDYLIGGSVAHNNNEKVLSTYWDDYDLLNALELKLKEEENG